MSEKQTKVNEWVENIKNMFTADNVINNMALLLLLVFLGVVYIANSHYHLQLEREIDKKEYELKQLGWEYMSLKSEVMYKSKQSEVAKAVEPLGLSPLTEPPKIIKIQK